MYIIIGGTGFLGSCIAGAVKEQTGEEPVIVSRTVGMSGGVMRSQ